MKPSKARAVGRLPPRVPPPAPLLLRVDLTFCSNCRQTRACAVLDGGYPLVRLCHECLLLIAEHLSGVNWLGNWRGIQNAKRIKAQMARERLAAAD